MIPKRYLKLKIDVIELDDDNKEKNRTNLIELGINSKISFTTTSSVAGGFSEANITITGLRPEVMAGISSSSTQWLKTARNNVITLEAGYEDRHNIIFEGTIIESKPSIENANYSMNIKAISRFFSQVNDIKSYSFKGGVKASEIANKFAKDLGFVFINGLKEDKIVNDYQKSDCSIQAHIRELSRITGLDVYIENNRLYIKSRGDGLPSIPELVVDKKNMVGSPKITPLGVDVLVKLRPDLISGQLVAVHSERFDIINTQKYVLQSVVYSGDTKGQDWTTRLNLTREGLYGVQ